MSDASDVPDMYEVEAGMYALNSSALTALTALTAVTAMTTMMQAREPLLC